MRQSMKFSAAGLGMVVGLASALALHNSQAAQPSDKASASAVSVSATEAPAAAAPAKGSQSVKGVAANHTPAPQPALSSLTIESGSKDASSFTLSGRDSRQQLIVTGAHGQRRIPATSRGKCITPSNRRASFASTPPGWCRPWPMEKRRSQRKLPAGKKASIGAVVVHFTDDPPVNFPNQIVPIFTKLGCNAGGCHGKASGQNGFRCRSWASCPAKITSIW